MSDKVIKILFSFLLVGSYFFLPKYGFTTFAYSAHDVSDILATHFLYPFSHANIWHLFANILCLWMISCRLHPIATYLIAVACSFLPSFCLYDSIAHCSLAALTVPTYGFSGILFAIVGVSWGRVHRFRDMLWKNKWYLVLPAFLPHVNFLIHLYCLLAGYIYGSICCYEKAAHKKKLCARKSENS
jgi:membrane associated rhomboid family serine protease